MTVPLSNVQKLKLQLFHRLQRCHRNAWKRYWSSFQLFLVAKLSIEEFHSLVEELLGPDKHLHNTFVAALLSTAYEEKDDGKGRLRPPPQSTQQLQIHTKHGQLSANGVTSPTFINDSLLDATSTTKHKEFASDSEQRLQRNSTKMVGRKRSLSSGPSFDSNAEEAAVQKLMRLSDDKFLDAHDHPDHHSAELLMGLGKCAQQK